MVGAGGTSVVDIAILILTAGDVVRNSIPTVLWIARKLDSLLD